MADHDHDWRKKPGSPMYRVRSDGAYMSPLRCASCSAKAWAVEDGLVETWPLWRGTVADIEEPNERDKVLDETKAEILATTAITVVRAKAGGFLAKARDDYGTVMGYCCDAEGPGHDTPEEASRHGHEKLAQVSYVS